MNKIAMATFVALLSVATVAAAEPNPDDAPKPRALRRVEIDNTVGLATPVGQFGVEGAFVVHRNLELGIGVGLANVINIGNTGKPDPQIAFMPRFRLPLGPVLITLGAGLSGGRYTVGSSPFADDIYYKFGALWLNGEVGASYVLDNGMYFGTYLGGGKIIAHGVIHDPRGGMNTTDTDALPYLGVRVGYSF